MKTNVIIQIVNPNTPNTVWHVIDAKTGDRLSANHQTEKSLKKAIKGTWKVIDPTKLPVEKKQANQSVNTFQPQIDQYQSLEMAKDRVAFIRNVNDVDLLDALYSQAESKGFKTVQEAFEIQARLLSEA